MKAKRVYYKRQRYAGGIVEMVVWELPAEVDRSHGYKYRLVFARDGGRVLGYDNERGKGGHKHYGEQEEPYRFVNVPTLLRDFWKDVRRLRCEEA